MDLQGDFRTYLRERSGVNASDVIPAIPGGAELTILVPFAVKPSTVNSPEALFDVSVTAYDPSGTLHTLLGEENGGAEESGAVSALTIGMISTVIAVAIAVAWLTWRRGKTKRREGRQND